MTPRKGYYSVIQYCPDLSRFEAANIGVLIFCPENGFLKAITASDNSRIIHFFGRKGHDWIRINAIKKAFNDRLGSEQDAIRSVEDLEMFIATRANSLRLTPLNPMKIFDPEKDLVELYERILGQPAKRKPRKDFRKFVAEKFAAAGLETKIRYNVRLDDPILGSEIEIPFGFQNGRFNLMTPVRFGAVDPEQSLRRAKQYAFEGRSFYEHSDEDFGELQLLVIGQFGLKDEGLRSNVQRIFDESHVKLYPSEELPKLIDVIRRTGKNFDTRFQVGISTPR